MWSSRVLVRFLGCWKSRNVVVGQFGQVFRLVLVNYQDILVLEFFLSELGVGRWLVQYIVVCQLRTVLVCFSLLFVVSFQFGFVREFWRFYSCVYLFSVESFWGLVLFFVFFRVFLLEKAFFIRCDLRSFGCLVVVGRENLGSCVRFQERIYVVSIFVNFSGEGQGLGVVSFGF